MKQINTISGNILIVDIPKDVISYTIENYPISERTNHHQYSSFTNERIRVLTGGYWCLLNLELPKSNENQLFNDKKLITLGKNESWKIIGKLSELKDEDVEEFVEDRLAHEGDLNTNGIQYKDYKTEMYPFWKPKESFISLLKANGVDTNKEQLILKQI